MVIETRLVVGSGNRITVAAGGKEFRGFYGDEGQCACRARGMSRIGRWGEVELLALCVQRMKWRLRARLLG